jgi:Tol biopolymer transport system component
MRPVLFNFLLLLLCSGSVQAQYFGRNKPRYNKEEFKVTQTPHFEIYEHLDNPDKLRELSAAAEVWYQMHQSVLRDTLPGRNPLIIYDDHAGFQQSNVVQGDISVGTGGVTEGLRNRVVFPVAVTNQQTHHVLGHELVHAFQYNMVLNGDSTSMQNLGNLPLWMIEGLAEYLSIGRIDPHTALWMRDAVQSGDIPEIKDLNNQKYFPYRWGQSFWAYVTGVYGDESIRPLFMNTAKYGLFVSVPMTLGTSVDSLSVAWQETLKNHYGRWVTKKKEDLPGRKLLDDSNAGTMNVCPVLSPNGKYVIFLSEKNLFTTDLFLADAKTGKIIRKVSSTLGDSHIDQFNSIESAGTWSPDSKRYAFDVYEKGKSILIIKSIEKKGKTEKIRLPGLTAFNNPAWSPDGKSIVVTGQLKGQTDLWQYDLKTKKLKRLTNNRYAEVLPAWSSDGSMIAFSTDELALERGRNNGAWQMNLAVMDVVSGSVDNIDVFPGADNMNPQFDKDGNLYFLSNRDGFRNLYRYALRDKKVWQLTNITTGITGITPYSPALTISEDKDKILYTHYSNHQYVIYQAKAGDFTAVETDPTAVDMVPASLPPFDPRRRDLVNTGLRLSDVNEKNTSDTLIARKQPFRPKFELAYLGGSTGMGVYTGNSSFGTQTGLAGGMDMLFNDILGNHQLYTGLALNGQVIDAAGQVSYINSKNRITWGANLSHIPFLSGGYYRRDPNYYLGVIETKYFRDGTPFLGWQDEQILERTFQQRVGVFAAYPLSVTRRFEVGSAMEFYKQRYDRYTYNYVFNNAGQYLGRYDEREKLQGGGALQLSNINAAFVGDNSYFGMTAPLQGYRYRIGVEQYFGGYNFTTLLLDGRKYFYMKPVTLAFRGMGYGRFGGNSAEIYPLFAGSPYFVRGYTRQVFDGDTTGLISRMAGSKVVVANAELRIPFTGPRRLSLIKAGFLITDLNLFFDAGLAFYDKTSFREEDPTPFDGQDHFVHRPILSTGASIRINLFGYLVLEPYFALPLSAPDDRRQWVWGLNFIPGW